MYYCDSQATEVSGMSSRELKYWRERGVLTHIKPTTSGKMSYYWYSQGELLELMLIKKLREFGLSFETIKKISQEVRYMCDRFIVCSDSYFAEPLGVETKQDIIYTNHEAFLHIRDSNDRLISKLGVFGSYASWKIITHREVAIVISLDALATKLKENLQCLS